MLWCDDETAQWCELILPVLVLPDRSVATRVHQARRILILPARMLVLVDPIDDEFDEALVMMLDEIERVPALRERRAKPSFHHS